MEKELTIDEIRHFLSEDSGSEIKAFARKGQAYYDADHDIKDYRLFYYNADGELVEDDTRSNIKIPHPFFPELVDQATQYILSGGDGFVKSDIVELQKELDSYFNNNEDFIAEFSETLDGCQIKGFDYMYAYKGADGKTSFMNADSIGVVEVRAKDTDAKADFIIYWFVDRIEKGHKRIKRIEVWDDTKTTYYVQSGDGEIVLDDDAPLNPRPHILYTDGVDSPVYYESYGVIPFFRLDNNKKRFSSLKPIKDLIDDYDLMASSLSNNLQDFDTPIHIVKGFEGDNLEELQTNLKTKKIVGVDTDGDVDVRTVDVPYQARQAKLELDERNIYRFGMGLNTAGLKDTNATTNIAIKAAYSLLDLKCGKLEKKIKQFLRKLVNIALDEINAKNDSGYNQDDVYIEFCHEVMSNAQENAQIEQLKAQKDATVINMLLGLVEELGEDSVVEMICDELDVDYEEIKSRLPKTESEYVDDAQKALDNVSVKEEDDLIE